MKSEYVDVRRWSNNCSFCKDLVPPSIPSPSPMRLVHFLRDSAVVVALTASLATTASGQVLHDNGPAVIGGLSVLRPGAAIFGVGMQTDVPNAVADDFTVAVAGGWNVTGFSFFGYQTGGVNGAFTFTGLSWSIVAGDVNTGSVVQSGSVVPTNGGLVGYRVSGTDQGSTTRAIFQIDADVPDFVLGMGQYWLQWSMTGTGISGPWQTSTADGVEGNAHQSLDGTDFALRLDDLDGLSMEYPFIIRGTAASTVVPEPSTWSMMIVGGLAMVAFSRRRRRID